MILFRRGTAARTRDLGRVAIGLGLMLMSLHRLVTLMTPYEDMPSLRLVLGAITTEPVLDVLVAAGLTWAAHSSVAVVLLVMSFAAKGAVPPEAAFALVLGANLGTAINPVLEGVSGDDPVARRLPIGNLLNRALGCVVALALLHRIGPLMVQVDADPARAVADFHTGFNLIVAALFLPAAGALRLGAAQAAAGAGRRGRSVAAALPGPGGAGIAADRAGRGGARGAAHGGRAGGDAGPGGGGAGEHRPPRIGEVRRLDDVLDRLNTAIKGYLTDWTPRTWPKSDHRRLSQILVFATNLEAAGDVVDRDVMGHRGQAPEARRAAGARRSRPRRGNCWIGSPPRCAPRRRCS